MTKQRTDNDSRRQDLIVYVLLGPGYILGVHAGVQHIGGLIFLVVVLEPIVPAVVAVWPDVLIRDETCPDTEISEE